MRKLLILLSLVLGLAFPAAAQDNPLEAYVYPGGTVIDSISSYRATLKGEVVRVYTLSYMIEEPIEQVAAYYEREIPGSETTETSLGQSKSVLVAPPGSIRGLQPEEIEVQAELSQMRQGPTRVMLRSGVEESAASR